MYSSLVKRVQLRRPCRQDCVSAVDVSAVTAIDYAAFPRAGHGGQVRRIQRFPRLIQLA
jgi:hypothetical protein